MTNINDKYKSVREWAIAYLKAGWSVIPLYNFLKLPNKVEYKDPDFGWMPGWAIFQERQATQEEFEHWFTLGQVTGLGVVSGPVSKIIVVDEDSYKGDGMTFEFSSPLRSITGRGGKHHFFKYTEPVKTSGFRKGVNIEIKSDGGFAILPPTEVWVDKEQMKKGKYIWESFCSLDKLPTITEKQLIKYKLGDWMSVGGYPKGVDMHELTGAMLGEQHNSLRTIALKTFGRFPQKEWDIAAKFVRDEAAKFVPPHPPKQVEKMISDCMIFMRNNSKETIEKQIDKPTFRPRTLREVGDERKAEKELEKHAPSTGYPELDNIIRGFVPGHLYTLTGDQNVGKTTLACNFTERVRKQGKKVLYFALEPENTVVDYLASIRTGKWFRDLTDEDIMFDDENISVYGKQEISTLADLLHVVRTAPIRYDLIIVDHVGYFIRDKDNHIQEQSNTLKELAWLAKEKSLAIVIIAHLRKKSASQKRGYIPTADDISGSGAFKQDSTEVLIVTRPPSSGDPKDTTLSNLGTLMVAKTKAGPNGYIDVCFSDRSALIMTPAEVEASLILTEQEKLKLQGFPTVQKPKVVGKVYDD